MQKRYVILLMVFVFTIGNTVMVPVHEGIHWVVFKAEPWAEPLSIELFDNVTFDSKYMFVSRLGTTNAVEEYPGSWNDRPWWIGILHEGLAYGLTGLMTIYISFWLTMLVKKHYSY